MRSLSDNWNFDFNFKQFMVNKMQLKNVYDEVKFLNLLLK